jgi:hypothetical protein
MSDFRQVTDHQRQVVTVIHLANLTNTVQRLPVTEMATEGVAGVSRQRDDGTVANELGGLGKQALLRRFGVDMDDAGHAQATRRQTGFRSSGNGGALPRST